MSLHHLLFPLLILASSAASSVSATEKEQTLNTQQANFFNPKLPPRTLSSSKKFEGSSEIVDLRYHMGPVLSSSPINIYLIWYGKWSASQKILIKDFINSISPSSAAAPPSPSVSDWWKTVSLYTDQTGANVSRNVVIAKEHSDTAYSHGSHLTRLSVQQVISTAVGAAPFPVDHRNGIYLVLTSNDVTVQEFCRAVCGFHYFTFPSMVGHTLPYAWIGNSGKQCPEVCAPTYPTPKPPTKPPIKPPTQRPTKPPTKPPTYPPSPPAKPPTYPRSSRVAVQGVVYCKSCKYAGVDTLLGAKPVIGATVKLACKDSKNDLTVQFQTDKNGYFFLQAPISIINFSLSNCSVSLVSSPLKSCGTPSNMNGGLKGAPLKPENSSTSKKLPYVLYSVGPFAFEPKCH